MVLKQRANFYNNIATEMIPCQKPMMLQDALDFEKVRAPVRGGHTRAMHPHPACLLTTPRAAVLLCCALPGVRLTLGRAAIGLPAWILVGHIDG